MKEDYFFNQNLKIGNSNYKILKTEYISSRDASNIENTDELYGIEELPYMGDEISNFQKSKTKYAINNPFKFNSHSNNLNLRSIKNIFNFDLSPGKINQTQYRKTEGGYIGEEKSPVKMQSRYNSASENKYNFIQRTNLDSNNINISAQNKNFIPVNVTKISQNSNEQNSNDIINRVYSNINSNSRNTWQSQSPTSPLNKNVITEANDSSSKKFEKKDNRFKSDSSYSFNTISGLKLQENIQSLLIDQNEESKNDNNKIVSNYNICGKNNNPFQNFKMKNKSQSNEINLYNYQNDQQRLTDVNYSFPKNNEIYSDNQRLTVGYKNLNNGDKNIINNQNPFKRNISPQQIIRNNKKNNNISPIDNIRSESSPFEVAVVTKISPDKNKNKIKINNNNSNTLGNKINEASQRGNLNKINNINYGNNKNFKIIINGRLPNKKNKSNSNKKKNQNQKFISPSKLNIPSQYIQKVQSDYSTRTNIVLSHQVLSPSTNNFNNINTMNNNINILNNIDNNANLNKLYNQPESERATIVNDNINNIANKASNQLNKNIDLKNNNFNGSGYLKYYGGLSHPGRDASGNRKTNQDSFVFLTNINNIKDFNIFGVLDGHGPEGHFVSQFATDFIPSQLIQNPEIKALSDPEKIYKKFKENNCRIITQAFVSADSQLKNMEFDSLESGTTCCLIIHIGKHIICANTGDSRALVVYDESGDMNNLKNINYLQAVPLSIDYKPELPEEYNRIIMSGGAVEQLEDEFGRRVGPYRVWAKGEDYPGLAMSRSIGDLKGKAIGVIPDPGILEYDLNKTTKYIVVCSDGVWEFLNNDMVKDLGKQFYLKNDAVSFCNKLIEQSLFEWNKNDIIVDDITAVVAFF